MAPLKVTPNFGWLCTETSHPMLYKLCPTEEDPDVAGILVGEITMTASNAKAETRHRAKTSMATAYQNAALVVSFFVSSIITG